MDKFLALRPCMCDFLGGLLGVGGSQQIFTFPLPQGLLLQYSAEQRMSVSLYDMVFSAQLQNTLQTFILLLLLFP